MGWWRGATQRTLEEAALVDSGEHEARDGGGVTRLAPWVGSRGRARVMVRVRVRGRGRGRGRVGVRV